jgi:hypothetical protein
MIDCHGFMIFASNGRTRWELCAEVGDGVKG